MTLESIGLITFDAISNFKLSPLPKKVEASYFGKSVILDLGVKNPHELQVGDAFFTDTGFELSRICTPEPIEGFYPIVTEWWKNEHGYKLSLET